MKTSNATETSALASARDSLRGPRGKTVWRSLEELAEKPSFQEMLQREFPRHAAEWGNVDRRRFLQLSGAGLGLAGLTACTKQPPEKIVPYVRQPEDVVPGKPMYYASAVSRSGYAAPVLGECHMGRPTKLEGNPEHPASRGGTDTITQASILDLYDPDRSEAITHLGQIRTWDAFVEQVEALRLQHVAQDGEDREVLGGEGLAFVTGNVTSPTMARLLAELDRQMPKARRFAVDSSAGAHGYGVTERAFGEALQTHFDFDKADVVLSVDADFLSDGPAGVAYSKVFSARRRAYNVDEARSMVRLYSVESVPSSTTATADHRLALHPTQVGHFLVALAARLGVAGAEEPEGLAEDPRVLAWLEEVTADLQTHAGRSAVVVGEFEDVELQVLGLAINEKLGNLDQTVFFTDPVVVRAKDDAGLPELATAIEAGEVTTLVLLGVNPVYDSPADIDMAALMEKVALRLHLGPHLDETAQYCHWHVPQSHDLESWGDLRSADGSVTVLQPLVNPLYDSHTAIDMVAAFLGRGDDGAMQLVQETWRAHYDAVGGGEQEGQTFERTWRRWLHDGFLRGTEEEPKPVSLDAAAGPWAAGALAGRTSLGPIVLFRPDPTILDGRYANNGWLQECPKPITRLTWDNALLMNPRTAEDYGFKDLFHHGDQLPKSPLANLTVGDRVLRDVAVWAVPGMADDVMLVHLGYGRRVGGKLADGAGVDANQVRTTGNLWRAHEDVKARRAGGNTTLASTQSHHSMEGRQHVRSTNVPTYEKYPDEPVYIHHHVDPNASAMSGKGLLTGEYQWAMSVDLSTCTGCNSCLVACQAENNIPVVGKQEVARGREMHWMRIDRYFVGDDPNDIEEVVHQPVSCMQCEQAPCEVVCPVAATVHSDEGLNDMVYNRCVGTRYCSNNCPYKVRRFNFLLYQDFDTPQLKLGRNPDVTVRSRGVMEKCTYCVQRINKKRIEAKRERRRIRDKEIVTACEQSCPSDSIVFGNIKLKEGETSKIAELRDNGLNYGVLEELGNRPRTTYLARVTNPNPKLWERLYPDRPLIEERAHHGDGHHGDGHGKGHHGDDHGKDHGGEHHGDDHGAGDSAH